MSTETLTRTVSPNKAKKSILRAFNKKRPIFLWGPPGIGKSEIVGQINDNVLKNSTIEKLDPMGVHTGDSNTVAPAQTCLI